MISLLSFQSILFSPHVLLRRGSKKWLGECLGLSTAVTEMQRSQGWETLAAGDLTHVACKNVTFGSNSEILFLGTVNILWSR